ncbi:MAG: DUF3253 domain-containing protein [Azospirillaceae bacterium]
MNGTHDSDTDIRPPADDDPLAVRLLEMAATARGVAPEAVARAIAAERAKPKDPPDLWRRYLTPVKQQALHLARQGRLEVLRKGVAVSPDAARGLVRYRVPGAAD